MKGAPFLLQRLQVSRRKNCMNNLYLLAARVMSGPVNAAIDVSQISALLTSIYDAIKTLVTPIALIAMGACGIIWIISSDMQSVAQAKKWLLRIGVGLIIVYMAGAIIGMITNGVGGSGTGAIISGAGLM